MNIVIFDTETTSLEKPFCYNIGYVIVDVENRETLLTREYVVEQIWHNLPLFSSAYYADKRPLYVSAMKAKTVKMMKFGYICQQMKRDFINFNVEYAFAYNSSFDEKVFNYNCDWYKCYNPFDTIPIADIRGYAHRFIVNDDYKAFCDEYELFTETGNYSTTAEAMYRYISGEVDFDEAHTALADSLIEKDILLKCLDCGADIKGNYPTLRSIEKRLERNFVVKKNGSVVFEDSCYNVMYRKKDCTVLLK